MDDYVIQNLIYEEEFMRAYRETHAFKFADRVTLYFTCRISLCLTSDPACEELTVQSFFWCPRTFSVQ